MKGTVRRCAGFTLGAVLSCQALGCAPESAAGNATPEGGLQSICGPTSELRDVELYDGKFGLPTAFVGRHRLAVGLLRWRSDLDARYRELSGNVRDQGWCTGTLIDDDLFLTAGHCLDNQDTPRLRLPREKGGIPLEPPEMAREFTVEFRFETPALPDATDYGSRVNVLRLEEYSRSDPDYAIMRLADRPGFHNGVARISPSDSMPGLPIALLQHPKAETMKVGSGPVARLLGPKITYDTIDTLDGSSGAGILDAVTGKLVGIHTNGGCTKDGDGENYGVTIGALTAVSQLIVDRVDRSRDFLVGDWNGDGSSDLGVFVDGCLYPDTDHDGAPEIGARLCPPDANAEQYFAGKWQAGAASGLGWRRRDCLFLDANPTQKLCFGAPFELLVADWNGDGRSDLGIRRGRCINFDLDLDGAVDTPDYCYGNGVAQDEYLVGHWDRTATTDSIAIREANTISIDADQDGDTDETRVFGDGGNQDQYLVGDWAGNGRSELAVRRGTVYTLQMLDDVPNVRREYRDFWTRP
ncbi:MAG TPA: serine protease [Polyangiaceae bacterium]|nr:serine protease [Polyangiaceae bacterium]